MSNIIKMLVSVSTILVMATVADPAFSDEPIGGSTIQYPPANLTDNGGRLGIAYETAAYSYQGINVVKVAEVDTASSLSGVIHAGDLIYGVNGFNLRGGSDFKSVVASGSPGTTITVSYLDSAHDFRAMTATVTLNSNLAKLQFPSDSSSSQTGTSALSTFCLKDHPVLCLAIGLAFAKGATDALSRSSGGSESSSSDNSGQVDDDAVQNAQLAAQRSNNLNAGLNENGTAP